MMYTHIISSMAVLIASLCAVHGLDCYDCNSTLDHNCQEHFNHNFKVNPLRPQKCTVWDGKYCIKVTGLWGGIVGTHRFCSSRDLGDQCQDIFYPDHDRMYRACIYTCHSDKCNTAANIWSPWTLISTVALATILLFLKKL